MSTSSLVNQNIAAAGVSPHIVSDGCSDPHTAGRPGWPNKRQRSCSSSCTQGTPAGLPWGMPGIGVLIDGAMQQAAQPGRQVARSATGKGGSTAVIDAGS